MVWYIFKRILYFVKRLSAKEAHLEGEKEGDVHDQWRRKEGTERRVGGGGGGKQNPNRWIK
jgi:hypothetical protein